MELEHDPSRRSSAIYCVTAIGVNVVGGFAGQITLGPAATFAVGARVGSVRSVKSTGTPPGAVHGKGYAGRAVPAHPPSRGTPRQVAPHRHCRMVGRGRSLQREEAQAHSPVAAGGAGRCGVLWWRRSTGEVPLLGACRSCRGPSRSHPDLEPNCAASGPEQRCRLVRSATRSWRLPSSSDRRDS
jgi:hypothetical protein